MFVHVQTRRCEACNADSEALTSSPIVDIPLEEIALTWKPVACPCGYFYQIQHYAVSFNKWHREKYSIEFEQKWAMNVEDKAKIEARLLKLGSTPIPNHLFSC